MQTPLNIADPEACQLAKLIAEHTGKSLTRVVVDALRHERERVVPRKWNQERIDRILAEAHALPDRDSRSVEQIMNDLYDENGMFR